jgi:hypothetical protein
LKNGCANECKPIDLSISNPFQRSAAPVTLQDDKIGGTPRAWSEDFDIKHLFGEDWNFPVVSPNKPGV